MADAQIEKTTVTIDIDGAEEKFVANGEVIVFDGFLKVYRESMDEESSSAQDEAYTLPVLHINDKLERTEIVSTERFSQGPVRYTEASLVHKMEELGIGRPSTYAPTISTIQQREYVQKGDRKGEERSYVINTLKGNSVTTRNKKEMVGSEKGKLLPTDIGIVVNDFLQKNFPDIMDFNFTAKVETQFDQIAEGKEEWKDMMRKFDDKFDPIVEQVIQQKSEHKAGERELGLDPKTGKPVYVKIGRFGPVAQIGSADDQEKPRFSQLPKDKSIETITLDEALELFKLPRTLGNYEGTEVSVGVGRFGPYILHNKKYVSLPKGIDPMTVSLDAAVELIEEKRRQEKERHIKSFDEDSKLELLKGRYGPYLSYEGKNYHIDKKLQEKALAGNMEYAECMDIIKKAPEPKTRRGGK